MFDKSGARYTVEIPVLVTLAGQAPFEAALFVKTGERLSDLLNDPRAFIPLRRPDGETMIAAKASILAVTEAPPPAEDAAATEEAELDDEAEALRKAEEARRQAAAGRPRRPFDPYEVLRVARAATTEEIRKAYKARMKAVHPDVIAALDLDEDLERAANLTAQKVNHAYQAILRERKASDVGVRGGDSS